MDDLCTYCRQEDTEKHTFFWCIRHKILQQEMHAKLMEILTINYILQTIKLSKASWNIVADTIKNMKIKEQDEPEYTLKICSGRWLQRAETK